MEEEDGHLSLGREVQCGRWEGASLPTAVTWVPLLPAHILLFSSSQAAQRDQ